MKPLILTTILSSEAFAVLQSQQILRAEIRHSSFKDEPNFVQAYRWMKQKMTKLIGPAPNFKTTPIWAWYRYSQRAMPLDLRVCHQAERPSYVVDLEVDPRRVLLSDFDDWHVVLSKYYCPKSSADEQWFEERCKDLGSDTSQDPYSNKLLKKHIIESWDRILRDPHGRYAPRPRPSDTSIQATLWEIRWEDVVRVRERRLFKP